jgi:hypothetical protein
MMALSEHARVLIAVKASPEPSTKYGDTVCVAGIRTDGPQPAWIRLYPVPFRYLESENQFNKYDLVSMDLVKASKDPRRESFTPDRSSIVVDGHLAVAQRPNHVLPLVDRSMCGVLEEIENDLNGPSLAVVRAASIDRLVFESHPGWSDAEMNRIKAWENQPDLLGTARARPIEAPRLRVSYKWKCESLSCNGHIQRLLDWELTAFQRRFNSESDEVLRAKIEQNFLVNMFPDSRTPHFYVGNFASGPKRKSFSILGAFPSTKEYADAPLF